MKPLIRHTLHKTLLIGLLAILAVGVLPAFAPLWDDAAPDAGSAPPPAYAYDILAQATELQVVPSAAFIQASDGDSGTDDANNWHFDINDGSLTSDSATDRVCLVAPLSLPTGSTIKNFSAYVKDNFGPDDITIYLDRTNFLGTWHELARVSSSGSAAGIATLSDSTITTDDNANIVSTDHNYHISFCLPPASGDLINVYGAQISYTPAANPTVQVFLPLVIKSEAPPPTILLITNQTGGTVNYTIYDTTEGDIVCNTVPNGATQACGTTFTAGTYGYRAVAHCGQKVGQRTYRPGNDALTPFRCQ